MSKKNKTLQWRNREIYADFCAHLRNGLPTMDAYAALSNTYDLDADYLRAIIRDQARKT